MTQFARESMHGEAASHAATRCRPRLRPGLVFILCPLCKSPVDLALLGDGDRPEPCARHRPVLTCVRFEPQA